MSELREKDFYTTSELAEMLCVSRISIFKRIRQGSIKGQKMGRNFIVFKKDIDLKMLVLKIKPKRTIHVNTC